ncbi:MAG TPA: hypothetical protein VF602_10065 [Pedobacter sp.]|jgi:hypothetical protein
MMKYASIILFLFILISCATQKPTGGATDYWAIAPDLTKVTYEGGNGKSIDSAIVIKNAENTRNGIASEYVFIAKIHGEKFKDWKPIGHATNTVNGRPIDMIKILLISKDETLSYYFDITDFYRKL